VGIENVVKLQAGIDALQQTNVEHNQYGFQEQYAKS
jgi:hypothetical protein